MNYFISNDRNQLDQMNRAGFEKIAGRIKDTAAWGNVITHPQQPLYALGIEKSDLDCFLFKSPTAAKLPILSAEDLAKEGWMS